MAKIRINFPIVFLHKCNFFFQTKKYFSKRVLFIPIIENIEENDSNRTRVLQIEQNWCQLGGEPKLALDLAEEQLHLGQKLNLQPGLLSYIALHCVEACSLVFTANQSPEICQKGRDYAQMAFTYGISAYGDQSEEAEVFLRVCSIWNKKDQKLTDAANNGDDEEDEDLFMVVQEAISKLRDIDKK